MDTTTKLLQVNKKHSKNALIFYLILVADTQLYWPSYVMKNFFSTVTYKPFIYIYFCKLYRFGKNLPSNMAAL